MVNDDAISIASLRGFLQRSGILRRARGMRAAAQLSLSSSSLDHPSLVRWSGGNLEGKAVVGKSYRN